MKIRHILAAGLLFVLALSSPAFAQNTWLTMQDAQTTGDGTVMERRISDYFIFCVEWSAGTGAGVITLEEAGGNAGAAYAGTWSSITTVTWAAASSQECVHLGSGAYGAIRARISTTVTGGTVTVYGRGNEAGVNR